MDYYKIQQQNCGRFGCKLEISNKKSKQKISTKVFSVNYIFVTKKNGIKEEKKKA